MIVIRPETEQDRQAVWDVNRAAFESDAEANLVDALRDGGYVEVSLVAVVDGEIVGGRVPLTSEARRTRSRSARSTISRTASLKPSASESRPTSSRTK